VDQFVFEVLVVFVESLALAHFDEKCLLRVWLWPTLMKSPWVRLDIFSSSIHPV